MEVETIETTAVETTQYDESEHDELNNNRYMFNHYRVSDISSIIERRVPVWAKNLDKDERDNLIHHSHMEPTKIFSLTTEYHGFPINSMVISDDFHATIFCPLSQ